MGNHGESLNVIGLISGGKDSFYSLLHCVANGHRIVALANLFPPPTTSPLAESEDLNSFMYQTAGHALIPLYAEALGLPLFRQQIRGSALNLSKDYYATPESIPVEDFERKTRVDDEDETESLLPLLMQVMTAYPTANAVCTGAILSTYQRTRVESVARRLDLIPLSYLWQYPSFTSHSPGKLLDDMAATDFDVRIVKVSSGGLDEALLWENLMDVRVRRRVQKAVDRFGGSVLGEGGEYETLVVNGPMPFWKGRLQIQAEDICIRKGEGGEAWIEFREGSGVVVTNENYSTVEEGKRQDLVTLPRLLDEEFAISDNDVPQPTVQGMLYTESWIVKPVMSMNTSTLTLSNITCPLDLLSAGQQMLAINTSITQSLSQHSVSSADNIIFTTILLRTMTDFASVNEVYSQLFTRPNPPARVTVACGDLLPLGTHLMVSVIVDRNTTSRDGLHVQSRSYWAPANIGPYSQAISTPLRPDRVGAHLVYVAGQIPLVPASMEVLQAEDREDDDAPSRSLSLFHSRACLALQHLWRIGIAMNVSWWTNAVAFIIGSENLSWKAMTAWNVWERLHQPRTCKDKSKDDEDTGNLDVWDLKYGGRGSLVQGHVESPSLPDFKRASDTARSHAPQFFAVQVDELPRGCDIEWQSCGIAYDDVATPTVEVFSYISMPLDDGASKEQFNTNLLAELNGRDKADGFDARIYTSRPDFLGDIAMQVIPCRSVWGPRGEQLMASVIIRNVSAT